MIPALMQDHILGQRERLVNYIQQIMGTACFFILGEIIINGVAPASYSEAFSLLSSLFSGAGKSYKVFSCLMIQDSSDTTPISINASPITIGATYEIDSYATGDDFTNVGAPSNNSGVKFMATGTTPSIWSNGSVLNITPAVPYVKILENTLGYVYFDYTSNGFYNFYFYNSVDENKVQIFSSNLHHKILL
jgi:hypothetical protein